MKAHERRASREPHIWRARSLSVYRFWRDRGYAIGARSASLIADRFGFADAIAPARSVSTSRCPDIR
ncbi:hypothetical protein CA601_31895 [Paraburkholderia hospita]|nr:hypothetical protein CA602_33395 [Paraburkholderia hospita]OUL80880.1 hypothetical protein CA601_31895 [Paraburkholderia hospita]